MKRLVYITDLENRSAGGGSYVVNWNIQKQLGHYFELLQPAPVVPRVNRVSKYYSAALRKILHIPSKFSYFSERVLKDNAKMVDSAMAIDHDVVLFRSATRWSACRPSNPYCVYLDVVFESFVDNTFHRNDFQSSDLERIFAKEARFLDGAALIFFESEWGMQKAISSYGLNPDNCIAIGRGCAITPPDEPGLPDEYSLLTVAMNFHQKGGDIVAGAYQILRQTNERIRWNIVGGEPPSQVLDMPGVTYHGYLDLDIPEDLHQYQNLLGRSFLIVHPTREDTNPLVLTEAAMYGCPAISVNKFAIPELIQSGDTGLLLVPPVGHETLASTIEALIHDQKRYRAMRRNAYEFSRQEFSWEVIGRRMAESIESRI